MELEPIVWSLRTENDDRREITVNKKRQRDGSNLYAVLQHGACLAKDGEWEYEPLPSNRDDDFLSRCRFETLEMAADAARRAIETEEAETQRLTEAKSGVASEAGSH